MTITGGPIFWLLLVMGVSAMVVFLERLFELRRAQIDCQDFVNGVINILDSNNEEEALAICEDAAVPVANVVATAIRQRSSPSRVLRDAVDSQGRAETSRLDRRLAILAIIGQIAPLVGLLGTIVGFIQAVMAANSEAVVSRFELMGAAVEAMTVAALGLAVAIPVSVMYNVLNIRLNRIVVEMEVAASRMIGYITTKESAK